jgi:putative endonuclease
MTDRRQAVGRRGEALAAAYLQQRGYGIIASNWRCAAGEIDIIATDAHELVFVEVRTRRGDLRGLAEESITRAKQRRLIALAETYLQHLEQERRPWPGAYRIDVVAIQLVSAEGDVRLRHLRHAVEAMEE